MSNKTSRLQPRAIALGTLILVAALVAQGVISRQSQAESLRALAAVQAVPVVKVVTPTTTEPAPLILPARVEAWARAPVNARVSGYLKRWHADIGTPVRAGQLLADIETPEADQQLAQAQSELTTALTNVRLAASTAERWQALLASDSVSRQEVDEKVSDLAAKQSLAKGLQANVERLQATRQFGRLVAPFDGVVTARNTDVGALVSAGSAPGQELFVVSDTLRLRVYVSVPQRQVPGIGVDTVATLSVPERPGQRYKARVNSVSQAIQPGTGGMLVQLTVENHSGELLPGSFATVSFAAGDASPGVAVPPGALIYGGAGVRVAVLEGDRAVIRQVKILRDLGAMVEVSAGLSTADRVIDSPPDGLRNGDRVRVAATQAGKAS